MSFLVGKSLRIRNDSVIPKITMSIKLEVSIKNHGENVDTKLNGLKNTSLTD